MRLRRCGMCRRRWMARRGPYKPRQARAPVWAHRPACSATPAARPHCCPQVRPVRTLRALRGHAAAARSLYRESAH